MPDKENVQTADTAGFNASLINARDAKNFPGCKTVLEQNNISYGFAGARTIATMVPLESSD